MSCLNQCLLMYVLLMMLRNQGNCSVRGRYYLKTTMYKFAAFYSENAMCDPLESDQHRFCDLRFNITVECSNCWHAKPKISSLPSTKSCYKDAQRTFFIGYKQDDYQMIIITDNTTVKYHVVVYDLDQNCENPRQIHAETVALRVPGDHLKKHKKFEIISQYGVLQFNNYIGCNEGCGKTCEDPVKPNIICINDAVVCINGYYSRECQEYLGPIAWHVKLLHFETDYVKQKMNSSCYEVAQACIMLRTEDYGKGCLVQSLIGWNHFSNPQNSVVRESDLMYFSPMFTNVSINKFVNVQIKVTTYCKGIKLNSKFGVFESGSVAKQNVFKVSNENRTLFGVITSCNTGTTGWQCLHAANQSSSRTWSCAANRSSVSCAYETMCSNYTCMNGGTCMLRRSKIDLSAFSEQPYVFHERQEDYSPACECSDNYRGPLCEEEITAVQTQASGEDFDNTRKNY